MAGFTPSITSRSFACGHFRATAPAVAPSRAGTACRKRTLASLVGPSAVSIAVINKAINANFVASGRALTGPASEQVP